MITINYTWCIQITNSLYLITHQSWLLLYNRSYHAERPCLWAYSRPSRLPPRESLLSAPLNFQTSNYDFWVTHSCIFLQHEFGDTTNGCISTGMSFDLSYFWQCHIFIYNLYLWSFLLCYKHWTSHLNVFLNLCCILYGLEFRGQQ
jgi:hypothetical protein